MTTDEMVRKINRAIDGLSCVLQDLEDARDGEIDIEDVNTAYASQTATLVNDVVLAINEA